LSATVKQKVSYILP